VNHTERTANDVLSGQVVAVLAQRMHRDAERAAWAAKLAAPAPRRAVTRLSFLQRLAQVAA